jgi:hypothetical protein
MMIGMGTPNRYPLRIFELGIFVLRRHVAQWPSDRLGLDCIILGLAGGWRHPWLDGRQRGTGQLFRCCKRTNRPVPELARSSNYLAQVLSAFKAVSADAFVE